MLAALTSAVYLIEIGVSFLIDAEQSRAIAATIVGGLVYLLGIPSCLSRETEFLGAGLKNILGMSWFDAADDLTPNWLLPLGGSRFLQLYAIYKLSHCFT